MSELNKLSDSLEYTLKDSDLQNVAISLAEVFTDSLIDDGIAKDIPIIGTVIGLGKTAVGIKESLFLKKVIYFISELKLINASKRREMIDKIDRSGKFRIKVGEKLLYIIDKCDDHEKSQVIARLFSAFILEKIRYDEFLRAAFIIDQLMIDDLKWFIESGWKNEDGWGHSNHLDYRYGYIKLEKVGSIATSGLFEIVSPEIRVEDQWDHKAYDKYVVEGSELTVRITDIGNKIKENLKDFF